MSLVARSAHDERCGTDSVVGHHRGHRTGPDASHLPVVPEAAAPTNSKRLEGMLDHGLRSGRLTSEQLAEVFGLVRRPPGCAILTRGDARIPPSLHRISTPPPAYAQAE